ncbi:hypothetical protein COCOBI_pt-1810 (chloroplast) [Coccomyxa sp. Obi]|nr:hypothetical protein COCOBI_pt-1810 [Coccomyxa sp. Obi]
MRSIWESIGNCVCNIITSCYIITEGILRIVTLAAKPPWVAKYAEKSFTTDELLPRRLTWTASCLRPKRRSVA